jgi:PAS domain S-box-containing protein
MTAEHEPDCDPAELTETLAEENALLGRRLKREREVRLQAEEIAENGLRALYQKQREIEFGSSIATMANQASSAGEALAAGLEHIAVVTGWSAAHAFVVSGDGAERRMWPSGIWHSDPGFDISELRSATAELICIPGEGLPGQVWKTGEPVWLDDLANCTNFPRRASALRSGMRVAFSVPLLAGSEVIGTLEFFGPSPMPKDQEFLDLAASAAAQLSRPIERERVEVQLSGATEELSDALEEGKRAVALLRANTDALFDPQVLFEGVRDSSGEIVDLIYRDVNLATTGYLGLSRDELVGHSCLETLPFLEDSGLLARYITCAQGGEPVDLDAFPYHNEILDDLRYYDIRGANAGPDLISLTWRDVTDRVDAAQHISASEAHFRLLAENAGDVVVHVRDNRFVWVSPSIEKVLGAPPEYWLGRETGEMIPPDDELTHAARVQQMRQGPFIGQARVVATDGTTHWVHAHAKPFYDADGNRDGVVTSFRLIDDEVAQRRITTQALLSHARADERYRKLMENSAVGMCLVTPKGRYAEVNQALCTFLGYDAQTLLGMSWQELTAADSLEEDLDKVEELLSGRIESYRTTKQYIHADGHQLWGDVTVSCMRNPDGEGDTLIAQVIDVTAEVEARSLVAAREQQTRVLAKRLQAKSDRLAAELNSAAKYVASILPGELAGPVRASSRYLPSRELGGDSYDYSWIDDDHLAVHLIDVSGHGIEPSLLSVSVHNLLRSGSLPAAVLSEPGQVLTALNRQFPMEDQGGHYLTMWYGTYQRSTRTLRYASAGHPPALVFAPEMSPTELSTAAYPVGMFDDSTFSTGTYTVPPGTDLLLYSDGALELPVHSGREFLRTDFVDLCSELARETDWSLDTLVERLRASTLAGQFDDDCSLVLLRFD